MTPAQARAWFPVLERTAYLNAGSIGPLSRRTYEVMAEWEERALHLGRASRRYFDRSLELRGRLCERLGAMLGVGDDRLVPTTSTTEGCNIVVAALRLRPEDEVVTTDAEHPGLEEPLRASGARLRLARVIGRTADQVRETVLAEVTPRTRLIALSHVLWVNGQVLPVVEIRRESGVPVLVDGAQSVGAIPVEASGVDFYTVSGQKWLCGPELTGALFVADPDGLRPAMAGYAASHGEGASRFGLAHHAASAVAGLLAAIEDRPEWGFEQAAFMAGRCREALVEAGLTVHSAPGQGALVSFGVDGDPAAMVARCQERDVVIRSLPNGWLRASCGWWTSEDDIARLVDALTA